jgi:hypothetical protein
MRRDTNGNDITLAESFEKRLGLDGVRWQLWNQRVAVEAQINTWKLEGGYN